MSPLRAAWPIPTSFAFATMLGGLVVGVLIGYVIGDTRAQLYHRMAEQARLQLELEERLSRSDARLAELLQALAARAARPEPVAAPPPVRPPILTVAPAPPLSPPVSS